MTTPTLAADPPAPRVSLGNWLTIGTVILSAGIAWGTVQQEVRTTRDMIAQQSLRMESFERGDDEQEIRIRTLETGFGRFEERLVFIAEGVERIERAVEGRP